MTHKSRQLIVSAAGSANSFGTIQSVREHFGDSVFVIATDTNPRELIAASVLADAFVRVPPALSPEFPAALRELAASYPGSYYLPILDDEIEISARLAVEGTLPVGLELIAPPYEVLRLCSDKWRMHDWLLAKGLPSPETALATPAALRTMPLPAILKPREGYASRGVRVIHTKEEVADRDPSQWLLQEQLQGFVTVVDIFLGRRSGTFFCLCGESIEVRATVPMKVRVFDDPVLADIAERLARGLPLCGAFQFQAMRDAAGRWRIIDVNPRVGSGTRMRAALGPDIAAANLADYWGESTDSLLQPITGEHYVVRQYTDYITSRSPSASARQ